MDKKNLKSIILFFSVTVLALVFVVYHLVNRNGVFKNIFKSEASFTSISDTSTTLLKIKDSNFRYEDLPDSVKKEILKEENIYQTKKRAILKTYAIRVNKLSLLNDGKIITEVPPLIKFIELKVDPPIIEKIYNEQKSNFPSNLSPEVIKNQINFNIISDRAMVFYQENLKNLYSSNFFQITNLFPYIPENWLDTKNIPTIGDSNSSNQLIVISNYFCKDCIKINNESLYFYKSNPNNTSLSLLILPGAGPVSKLLSFFSNCIYKNEPNIFWGYQENIISLLTKLEIKDEEKFLNQSKNLVTQLMNKFNLDHKQIESCTSNFSLLNEQENKIREQFSFIDLSQLPIAIFNKRILDLELLELNQAILKNSK